MIIFHDPWGDLGAGYLGEDPCARALFDLLAPIGAAGCRSPIYRRKGTTRAELPEKVWLLAEKLAATAREAVGEPPLADRSRGSYPESNDA